jgi:hypothetical protein
MAEPNRRARSTQRRPGRSLWLAIPFMLAMAMPAAAQSLVSPLNSIYSPPNPYGDPTAAPPGQSALDESVVLRNRPDYDALGIHAGGFLVFPNLEIGEKYDDNIRDTEHHRLDDFATTVAPSITAESTWSRHGLGVQAFGAFTEFAEHTSEDTNEGGINVTGRLDITDQDFLSQFLSYSHQVQPRDEPDDVGQRHPSVFDLYVSRSSYAHRFSRIEIRLDSSFQRLDYASDFDNDRDRSDFTIGPRISYLLSPSFIPFIQASYVDEAFDAAADRSGLDRDSQTYNAQAGFTYDIGTTLSGEVAAGVFHTDFDDPTFDPVTNFGFRGSLTWNVTALTTITGTISRQALVTTQIGSSSRIATQGILRVDHQLLHNVLIGGQVRYRNDDYQTSPREDNTLDAEIGASYLLNRNVSLNLDYEYTVRDSNAVDSSFRDNVIRLGVDFKM